MLNGRLMSYVNVYHLFAEPYIIPLFFQFVLAGVLVFGGDIYDIFRNGDEVI